MRRIARWLVHYAVLTVFASAALSLLLAAQLPWLDVDLAAGEDYRLQFYGGSPGVDVNVRYGETDRPRDWAFEINLLAEDLAGLRDAETPVRNGQHGFEQVCLYPTVPRLRRAELARRLREALAADDPLPRDLLDAVLLSPTLARAVWASQPSPVQDAMGDLAGALEQIPDAIGRATHRLLQDSGLRRVVLREAPRESRRREAALVDAAAAVVDRHRGRLNAEIDVLGAPVARVYLARRARRRAAWMLGGSLAVVAVVVFLALRRLGAVAAALGAAALSGLWTLGLMAWAGVSLTGPMVVLGPVLLGVSAGFALHVLAAGAGSSGPREAAERGLARGFLPVLLAGNLLVAGCLWLALSEREAVRDLGLVGVMGMLCALVVALGVVPGLARWLRPARASRPGTLAAALALAAALVAGGLWVSAPGEVGAAQVRLLAIAFGVLALLGVTRCLLWEKEEEGRSRQSAGGSGR